MKQKFGLADKLAKRFQSLKLMQIQTSGLIFRFFNFITNCIPTVESLEAADAEERFNTQMKTVLVNFQIADSFHKSVWEPKNSPEKVHFKV